MRQVAFIIRQSNNPKKAVLLDAQLGIIEAFFASTNGWQVGACISYVADYKPHLYFIKAFQLEDLPLAIAAQDILFLHHVLELIYFFVPIGSCSIGLFNLLEFLYTCATHILVADRRWKKLFICYVLYTIGMYDERSLRTYQFLRTLTNTPIDRVDVGFLDLAREREIDQWLLHCVELHPKVGDFKTMHFLTLHRIL